MDELADEAEITRCLNEATDLLDQTERFLDRVDELLAEADARILLLRRQTDNVN